MHLRTSMVTHHVYFVAQQDTVYGGATADLAARLRRLWLARRLRDDAGPYDGTSTWIAADGKPIVRICRTRTSNFVDVEVLDVAPDELEAPIAEERPNQLC